MQILLYGTLCSINALHKGQEVWLSSEHLKDANMICVSLDFKDYNIEKIVEHKHTYTVKKKKTNKN